MKENRVIELKRKPAVLGWASVAGEQESKGPLARYFDVLYPNDGISSSTWEEAEASLVHEAVETLLQKTNMLYNDIDIISGGDLLNQCTATTFGVKKFGIPFAGLFGACSTFALSLCLSAMLVDGGYAENAASVASSHFCSAEKQFRYPLEYGGQRTQTAQRTVTGAGACLVSCESAKIRIPKVMIGRVTDYEITDMANMGAAMAPAACNTIGDFLKQTRTEPEDYDMILTGDLGKVGSDLLKQLLKENCCMDISAVHEDCGCMIFDETKQDVHAGGSGCGCSASVFCSKILRDMNEGRLKKVLFAGTGALMSPLTSLQKETIPGIAHAVLLSTEE